MAASSTVRDMGPTWSMDHDPAATPYRLTLPQLGLSPDSPHQAAGRRIEPPVSSPNDVAHRKAAVAEPDPPLEPPVNLLRSQGLRLGLYCCDAPRANSVRLVLPNKTAPALFKLATAVASSSGMNSDIKREPTVVRTPLVHNWSFTATGTPCIGPK